MYAMMKPLNTAQTLDGLFSAVEQRILTNILEGNSNVVFIEEYTVVKAHVGRQGSSIVSGNWSNSSPGTGSLAAFFDDDASFLFQRPRIISWAS
jgi:hypothetical protein